jgi:hypothetical protein
MVLLRFGLWVFAELAIIVFAVIAARRHKQLGLWFLVSAVILAVLDDVLHAVWTDMFLTRQTGNITVYLALLGYGYSAAMVTALCGWGILAFSRKKGEKPDAS